MQQSTPSHFQTLHMAIQHPPASARTSMELESILTEIWCIELKIAHIELDQNFFDMGSKSLTIRTVQVQLQNRLQLLIPIHTFYTHPTIRDMVRYLTQEHRSTSPP